MVDFVHFSDFCLISALFGLLFIYIIFQFYFIFASISQRAPAKKKSKVLVQTQFCIFRVPFTLRIKYCHRVKDFCLSPSEIIKVKGFLGKKLICSLLSEVFSRQTSRLGGSVGKALDFSARVPGFKSPPAKLFFI